MIYGKPPKMIANIKAEPSEYCFCLYMPIFMGSGEIKIPDHLKWASKIVKEALKDNDDYYGKYVYLTVKYMFVSGHSGNRPDWHSDGFMTDDINYVWCDSSPTEYCVQDFYLTQDHNVSMIEMKQQACEENIITPRSFDLVRIDQGVIHRVPFCPDGFRAFVKVSISSNKYNLKGNAHNYGFKYDWSLKVRTLERNCPSTKEKLILK